MLPEITLKRRIAVKGLNVLKIPDEEEKNMKEDIREDIKAFYGGIAKTVTNSGSGSCCNASCCGDSLKDTKLFEYEGDFLNGLPEEAVNASLGCANPLSFANLQPGETVLDLGSGGGIDVLISSRLVGQTGKVYGLDMTDDMLALANHNLLKSGVKNVEFLKGYIEEIPLSDEQVDVVTSNCVINLSEDKEKVLEEAYRVLKPGGRLAVADIIEMKDVSDGVKENLKLWLGCIAGALTVEKYQRYLKRAGFKSIEVEPVTHYTKELIRDLTTDMNLGDLYAQMDEDELDGAFAAAYIKAVK